MKIVCIIPARYHSSRFPGKPLCDLAGKSMLERVYVRVSAWPHFLKIFVATDDELIGNHCREHNIPVILTGKHHMDCLDRAGEATNILENQGEDIDRVIIVQGDEPLFDTRSLDTDYEPEVVNFYTQVRDETEIHDRNQVKVVVALDGRARYFSRLALPDRHPSTARSEELPVIYKQLGIYAFSPRALYQFTALPPSPLESCEGIGLNRLLDNGIDVWMRYTKYDSVSIDTPEDRERVLKLLEKKAIND